MQKKNLAGFYFLLLPSYFSISIAQLPDYPITKSVAAGSQHLTGQPLPLTISHISLSINHLVDSKTARPREMRL